MKECDLQIESNPKGIVLSLTKNIPDYEYIVQSAKLGQKRLKYNANLILLRVVNVEEVNKNKKTPKIEELVSVLRIKKSSISSTYIGGPGLPTLIKLYK